ncbi:MAG: DUF1080 domain-containing protein [Bacteroidales bacterium]|nr:DUF1080 domain-containing protein [Bacteroidales bacterium]
MKNTEKQSITRIFVVLLIIAVIVIISIVTDKRDSKVAPIAFDTVYLFNGQDLSNWDIVLKDSLADPDLTFFIKDGNIQTSGDPFGYIRTAERFSDFELSVEWRWLAEPGNSGVFIHIQEDNIWPVCLECQLMNQKAGDFVCFPGFDFAEHTDKENWAVSKRAESSEKPAGEWNHYDIRVVGDSVSIYVNNVLQNIATQTKFTEGHIALQSEGAPLEFRNVFLVPVK